MFIETTLMRYGHGKLGIMGLTLKPETLKIWGLCLHICSRLEEDLADISSPEKKEGQEKHKEENKGRTESDANDWESIQSLGKNCNKLSSWRPSCPHSFKVIDLFSFKLSVFN